MKHGKRYIESSKLVDKNALLQPNEALELCIKTAKAKFDETVELHLKMGVDSRYADQQIRGAVNLPNGTGKKYKDADRVTKIYFKTTDEMLNERFLSVLSTKENVTYSKV